MHPNTVERHRLQQRRLSFSGADPLAAAAAAAAAAAQPSASEQRRDAGSSTPLDKLARHLDSASRQEREQAQQQAQQGEQTQQAEPKVHPAQAALAASLDAAGDFEFGGAERLMSQEDADLLASMPEHLRRMSTDGIISLDTLRVGLGGWGCSAHVQCPMPFGAGFSDCRLLQMCDPARRCGAAVACSMLAPLRPLPRPA